jgi:recombination associated protein RdgC
VRTQVRRSTSILQQLATHAIEATDAPTPHPQAKPQPHAAPSSKIGLWPKEWAVVSQRRKSVFKNVTVYRIAPGWAPTLGAMEAALDAQRFVPCGASQDKSVGWVEPRGEAHGPLVESVAGQRILKFVMETKSVPGDIVREKAQEEADHIEATTGRKPGKKQTKELREDALQALLPMAFPLVAAFNDLSITLLQTAVTPQTAMTNWLSAESPDDWPAGFNVERECELKSGDEEKSVVKFTRHNLATEEVRKHITEGKLPTKLAMSWEGRIGFMLTESMQLKKIAFLEGVFDDRASDDESGFDTDVALSTGELQKLLPELIEALGGEVAFGEMPIGTTGAADSSGTSKPHGEAVVAVGEGEAPF